MALRITQGVRTDKLKQDLVTLLDLPEVTLQRLGSWLGSGENPLPVTSVDFSRMADAVEVERQSLLELMSLIRFVMVNWRRLGLSRADIGADLAEMGFNSEAIAKGQSFFAQLEPSKEQFFVLSIRTAVEQAGLPTIDDMTLLWDLRPIFGSAAYPSIVGDEAGVTEWISHTYMLLFEINASRADGRKEPLSIQLNESAFAELENAIIRARKQLEVLKSKRLV